MYLRPDGHVGVGVHSWAHTPGRESDGHGVILKVMYLCFSPSNLSPRAAVSTWRWFPPGSLQGVLVQYRTYSSHFSTCQTGQWPTGFNGFLHAHGSVKCSGCAPGIRTGDAVCTCHVNTQLGQNFDMEPVISRCSPDTAPHLSTTNLWRARAA